MDSTRFRRQWLARCFRCFVIIFGILASRRFTRPRNNSFPKLRGFICPWYFSWYSWSKWGARFSFKPRPVKINANAFVFNCSRWLLGGCSNSSPRPSLARAPSVIENSNAWNFWNLWNPCRVVTYAQLRDRRGSSRLSNDPRKPMAKLWTRIVRISSSFTEFSDNSL